jgi:hypothetical protein
MKSIVALIVLGITVVGIIFGASTAISIVHITSDTMQIASGNANASQDLGQSISDEITFDAYSALTIGIIIAVCTAIGVPVAIIAALKKL